MLPQPGVRVMMEWSHRVVVPDTQVDAMVIGWEVFIPPLLWFWLMMLDFFSPASPLMKSNFSKSMDNTPPGLC